MLYFSLAESLQFATETYFEIFSFAFKSIFSLKIKVMVMFIGLLNITYNHLLLQREFSLLESNDIKIKGINFNCFTFSLIVEF